MLIGEFVEFEEKQFRNDDGSVRNYIVVTYCDVDAAGNAARKTKDFTVYDADAIVAFSKFREGERFQVACKKVSGVSKVELIGNDVDLFGKQ